MCSISERNRSSSSPSSASPSASRSEAATWGASADKRLGIGGMETLRACIDIFAGRFESEPSFDAEPVQQPFVGTPAPAHADGEIEVHARAQLPLELLARRGAYRADHGPALADDDALLRLR